MTAGPTLPDDVQVAMRKPKQVFGRYVLLKELGRGGMGAVYKAWQLDLRRYVAIKFLLGGQGEEELKRFYREAQTAAQVSHANITAIYEVGVYDEKHFIAMEFIDGHTFDKTPVPQDRAAMLRVVEVVRDAARGVDFAHSKGIIHRDLKPANIMVTKQGKAYVTDFGLARQVKGDIKITGTGLVVGTPPYMSPEQAQGDAKRLDRFTDIWSLGATLYASLTGKPPFEGGGAIATLHQVVHKDPRPPTRLNPKIPVELEAVCLKAMEKSKARRYRTAGEFAEDLDRFLRGEPMIAKPASAARRAMKFARRRWPVVAAGGLGLVALTVWLVVSSARRSRWDEMQVRAERLFQERKWADCLTLCQEIKGAGGSGAEIERMILECESQVKRIESGKTDLAQRAKAQPEFDLGQQKIEETRSLLRRPNAGVGRVRARLREAAGHFEKASSIDPRWREPWKALAEISNELRDEAGLAYALRMVDLDAQDPFGYYFRAKLRLWRLFKESATLTRLTVQSPQYDLAGESRAILEDLESATNRGISDFHLDTAAGLSRYASNDHEGALKAFRTGLAKAPDDPDLTLLAAVTAMILKSYNAKLVSDSFAPIQAAYQIRPNDLFAIVAYTHELAVRKDETALAILDSARQGTEGSALESILRTVRLDLLFALGRTADDSKTEDAFAILSWVEGRKLTGREAEERLREAKKHNPLCTFWADSILLGNNLAAGTREGAVEAEFLIDRLLRERFFDRLAMGRAKEASLLASRAQAHALRREFQKALEDAEAALKIFRDLAAYHVGAVACYHLGRWDDALRYAQGALDSTDRERNPELCRELDEFIQKVRSETPK